MTRLLTNELPAFGRTFSKNYQVCRWQDYCGLSLAKTYALSKKHGEKINEQISLRVTSDSNPLSARLRRLPNYRASACPESRLTKCEMDLSTGACDEHSLRMYLHEQRFLHGFAPNMKKGHRSRADASDNFCSLVSRGNRQIKYYG
jgi:hypothetical protein